MPYYECRTCSTPTPQPGFCSDCAPRVVSAEEVMGYNKAWSEAAPEIDRLRADLAEAREVIERIERESVDDVSRADARAFLERTTNANQTGDADGPKG